MFTRPAPEGMLGILAIATRSGLAWIATACEAKGKISKPKKAVRNMEFKAFIFICSLQNIKGRYAASVSIMFILSYLRLSHKREMMKLVIQTSALALYRMTTPDFRRRHNRREIPPPYEKGNLTLPASHSPGAPLWGG